MGMKVKARNPSSQGEKKSQPSIHSRRLSPPHRRLTRVVEIGVCVLAIPTGARTPGTASAAGEARSSFLACPVLGKSEQLSGDSAYGEGAPAGECHAGRRPGSS